MTRQHISTGSPFEAQAGYARALVQPPWCFVSGTTGYDYASMTMPEAVQDQARQALATIAATLDQAGFALTDVVRLTLYITDAAYADLVFPIMGETFRNIRPAASMIVCGLIRPEMKIEIEATALKDTAA
jgi:enamine deaminase RidA (YjgF/YER057c/UK114 family)